MTANVIHDLTIPSPTDKFTDVGWDAQFQYLSDVHFITARVSYIYEWEKLDGSLAIGNAANQKNQLTDFNASVTYAYDARYSVTLGYFNTTGSTDLDPTTGTSFFGTLNGSPNTSGEIIDIGYSPWSRGGPAFWPWLNTRLGVKFLHYDKLQGASTDYALNSDGTHSATRGTMTRPCSMRGRLFRFAPCKSSPDIRVIRPQGSAQNSLRGRNSCFRSYSLYLSWQLVFLG